MFSSLDPNLLNDLLLNIHKRSPNAELIINTIDYTIVSYNSKTNALYDSSSDKELLNKNLNILFPAVSYSILISNIDILLSRLLSNNSKELLIKEDLQIKNRKGTFINVQIKIIALDFTTDASNPINKNFVGIIIRDCSEEAIFKAETLKRQEQLKQQLKTVQLNNQELRISKSELEITLRRNLSQERITNYLLLSVAGLVSLIIFVSIFVRIPESIVTLVKDILLIVISSLATAVSGLFGLKQENTKELKEPQSFKDNRR